MVHRSIVVIATLIVAGIAATPAHATWSGRNGQIVWAAPAAQVSNDGVGRVAVASTGTTRPRTLYTCPNSSIPGCSVQVREGPVWSPDGRRFAVSFGTQIAIADADGTNWQLLPRQTRADRSPVWSADGTRLAFVGSKGPDGSTTVDLFTVRVDGTELKQITFDQAVTDVAWSSRGRIAYTVSPVNFGHKRYGRLVTIDDDGGHRRVILTGDSPGRPDWSPDGKRLLFIRQSGPRGGLTLGRDSRRGLRVVRTVGSEALFSPDGKSILIKSSRPGHHRYALADLNGRRRKTLRIEFPPAWQPVDLQSWQPRPRR
jgi:Tol biopolymer transport system component